MTPSKWWETSEKWREMDTERDGVEFVPREYDAMLDEAAQIYARWRQGADAETDPMYQGPFQVSFNNALLFMPDVLDMVCRLEVGDTSGRRDDGMDVIHDLVRAVSAFRPFDELSPEEQQILRDRFPGRFA